MTALKICLRVVFLASWCVPLAWTVWLVQWSIMHSWRLAVDCATCVTVTSIFGNKAGDAVIDRQIARNRLGASGRKVDARKTE